MKKKKTVIKASAIEAYLLMSKNISWVVFLSLMWLYLILKILFN